MRILSALVASTVLAAVAVVSAAEPKKPKPDAAEKPLKADAEYRAKMKALNRKVMSRPDEAAGRTEQHADGERKATTKGDTPAPAIPAKQPAAELKPGHFRQSIDDLQFDDSTLIGMTLAEAERAVEADPDSAILCRSNEIEYVLIPRIGGVNDFNKGMPTPIIFLVVTVKDEKITKVKRNTDALKPIPCSGGGKPETAVVRPQDDGPGIYRVYRHGAPKPTWTDIRAESRLDAVQKAIKSGTPMNPQYDDEGRLRYANIGKVRPIGPGASKQRERARK